MEMADQLLQGSVSAGEASDAAAVAAINNGKPGKVPDGTATVAASGNVDGIDKATFVSLMVKVHFLVIHPPVRLCWLIDWLVG